MQFRPDGTVDRSLVNISRDERIDHAFLDANGDGLVDVLVIDRDATQLMLRLNTGRGFDGGRLIEPPSHLAQAYLRRRSVDVRVLDYNADGRQDFVLLYEGDGGTAPSVAILHLSAVDPELRDITFEVSVLPIQAGFQGYPRNWNTTQILDSNGDGLPDIVQVVGEDVVVHVNRGEIPDRLERIEGDHSEPTSFEYAPHAQVGERASDCQYPQSCSQRGIDVVTGHALPTDTGLLHWFRNFYRAPRSDVRGRGWLGFERVTTNEITGGLTSVSSEYDLETRWSTWFEGRDTYAYLGVGRPRVVTQASQLDTTRTHVVQQITQPTVVGFDGGLYRYVIRPLHERRRELEVPDWPVSLEGREPLTEQIRTSEWDDDGFLTRQTSETVGVTREVVETPRVRSRDGRILGLVDYVRVQSWGDLANQPGMSATRFVDLDHDHRGRVWQVVRGGSETEWRETTYGFDEHGNVTGTWVRGRVPVDPDGLAFEDVLREETVDYDQNGVFPLEIRNSLGHLTTLQYEAVLGVLQRVTDPNGLEHRSFYDGFGRLRRHQPADGAAVELRYLSAADEANDPEPWVRVEIEGADGSRSTVDLDSFGRTRRTRTLILDAGSARWSVQLADLDIRGRVTRATLPAWEGVSPQRVLYQYDSLDRVTRRDWAGRITTHTYQGLVHTVRPPRGVRRMYTFDRAHRLAQTDEGSAGVTTQYRYGPFGNLLDVVAADARWRATYDTWGRRIELDDPDSGIERTIYDSFDDVVFTYNGAGEELHVRRDRLGRQIERRSSVDGTTWFSWDAPEDGVGRLSFACSEDGIVCNEYDYDALGHRSLERLTVSGVGTFDTEYDYDELGRLSLLRYPEVAGRTRRFAVRFGYDALGAETSVREEGGAATTFYAAWGRDARGNARRDSIGPLMRNRTFSPITGLLERVRTQRFSTADPVRPGISLVTLQDLDFSYDSVGNLERRVDRVAGRSERFVYDALDRLDWWQVDSSPIVDFRYDRAGNLTFNAGVVQEYGPRSGEEMVGPHALRRSGGNEYRYDAAGRQISGGTRRRIDYTAAGLPRRIETTAGATTTYRYGPSGQRVHASSDRERITYAGDLFELRQGARGEPTYVFHVFAAGQEVAQVSRTGTAESTAFLLTDALGTIDATTDAAGNVLERFQYAPFGGRVNPTGAASQTVRHRWVGHESDDATGLVNMRGRMYDPATGRFLTTDPVSLAPWAPQSLNSYSYVLNNPTSLRDSTGLWCDGLTYSSCPDGSTPSDRGASAGIGPGDSWRPLSPTAVGTPPRADSAGSSRGGAPQFVGTGGSWLPDGVVAASDWLESSGTADLLAGAGDVMTLGFSYVFREVTQVDAGVIDSSSDEYSAGMVLGGVVVTGGTLGASTGGGMLVGDVVAARVLSSAGLRTTWAFGTNWAYGEITGGAALGGGAVAMTAAAGGGGGGGGGATAIRRVGELLGTVDDVLANPRLLAGRSLEEVRLLIGRTVGWVDDVMRRSTRHPNGGWVFRELNEAGTDFTGRMIQYHPGTPRHFGGTPYWKVSGVPGQAPVRIPLGPEG